MSTRTLPTILLLMLLLLLLLLLQGCGSQGLPKVIYLARHGQTEWNRKARFQGDPDLDSVGYINRVSLWSLLKHKPIKAIYTSELLRTRRTADLVARQHKLKIRRRGALNEIQPGILEGICFSQMAPHKARPHARACEVQARGSNPKATLPIIQKAFKEAEKDRLKGRFPLGENYDDMLKRTTPFIQELQNGLRPRQVLIVAHGVINRVLLHKLVGWPLHNLAHIRQENDQVYRMEISWSGKVRLFLYTPGTGWRPCTVIPRPGQRYLSCNPLSQNKPTKVYEVEVKPSAGKVAVPVKQPAAEGVGTEAKPVLGPERRAEPGKP